MKEIAPCYCIAVVSEIDILCQHGRSLSGVACSRNTLIFGWMLRSRSIQRRAVHAISLHQFNVCHGKWVGSGRVTLRHVSPIPPLDPYVRLSPHTAHEKGMLWDISISPAPQHIHCGQLYAFAGYLCTMPLPSPSGRCLSRGVATSTRLQNRT